MSKRKRSGKRPGKAGGRRGTAPARAAAAKAPSAPPPVWRRALWPGLAVAGIAIVALILQSAMAARASDFDGERAHADIVAQCEFGARIPGEPAHVACRDWIVEQIEAVGMTAELQAFDSHLALIDKDAPAWNIWALPKPLAEARAAGREPTGGPYIVISAHWDTRPYGDNEPEGRKMLPFVGANDGGSGVAVALEMMRVLKGTPLADRIILAFWDAEDSGLQFQDDTWCIGSQYAAKHWKEETPFLGNIQLGINLDMVAGADLNLIREGYSQDESPGAVERLWRLGESRAPRIFSAGELPTYYTDDHLPFIEAGLPFIDLIGVPYEYWHKVGDTPANCSPEVMEALGNVLLEFVAAELGEPAGAP